MELLAVTPEEETNALRVEVQFPTRPDLDIWAPLLVVYMTNPNNAEPEPFAVYELVEGGEVSSEAVKTICEDRRLFAELCDLVDQELTEEY